MAIPAWLAAGASTIQSSGSADITFSWPAIGHQVDDVALLLIETSGDATAPPAPADWTEVADSPSVSNAPPTGTTDTRLSVFWRRATSTSESAVTVARGSNNHIGGRMYQFRGCVASGVPYDVTAANGQGTTSTSVSVPGDTTTVNDCLVLAICSRHTDTAATEFSGWANADLSNITEIDDCGWTAANGGGIVIVSGEKATAGPFGATTGTLATTALQARLMVALRPVVAGGAGSAAPGVGELTLTGFAPTFASGGGATVAPGTGLLVLTGFEPTVTGDPPPVNTANLTRASVSITIGI